MATKFFHPSGNHFCSPRCDFPLEIASYNGIQIWHRSCYNNWWVWSPGPLLRFSLNPPSQFLKAIFVVVVEEMCSFVFLPFSRSAFVDCSLHVSFLCSSVPRISWLLLARFTKGRISMRIDLDVLSFARLCLFFK